MPYYEAAAARGLRLLFHTGILGGPVDYLEGGYTIDAFLDNFPSVRREQVNAFLEQART